MKAALGKAIRATRVEHGYTQESFARHAGLDRGYYGAIERGKFNLTIETLAKIAKALDTTVAALCERAGL